MLLVSVLDSPEDSSWSLLSSSWTIANTGVPLFVDDDRIDFLRNFPLLTLSSSLSVPFPSVLGSSCNSMWSVSSSVLTRDNAGLVNDGPMGYNFLLVSSVSVVALTLLRVDRRKT